MSLKLPLHWTKGINLYDDEPLIFTVGRFKLYQPINEHILVLFDTRLNESWRCDCCFNSRKEYEDEIKSVKKILNEYYRELKGKQLKLF